MTTAADAPIFSMLKSRMTMLGQRQKVIAENVANVSTPKFTPQDVDADKFQKALAQNIASQGPSASTP
ncbi:MAG: flagellar basal body protein, partial [Pseudomonadota bacterium]